MSLILSTSHICYANLRKTGGVVNGCAMTEVQVMQTPESRFGLAAVLIEQLAF
jgi:hypothetical protein